MADIRDIMTSPRHKPIGSQWWILPTFAFWQHPEVRGIYWLLVAWYMALYIAITSQIEFSDESLSTFTLAAIFAQGLLERELRKRGVPDSA